jgi:uncharacterized protein (DUF1330 family)
MAKGYWIGLNDVTDPERYKSYVAAGAEAFAKYGARFLARGGRSERPEGTTRARVVIIEFPSYEAALACYRSPEYAKAHALRQGAAESDVVLVEGCEGLQPTA